MKLKKCPFCGELPTSEPWHGGGPEKTMVSCANEQCTVSPAVTGETPQAAADKWNTRAPEVM